MSFKTTRLRSATFSVGISCLIVSSASFRELIFSNVGPTGQPTVGTCREDYTETDTILGSPRSAWYFQNPGSSGMQPRTPRKQITPPEIIDIWLVETVATQPARAFPNNGPLR